MYSRHNNIVTFEDLADGGCAGEKVHVGVLMCHIGQDLMVKVYGMSQWRPFRRNTWMSELINEIFKPYL